MVVLRRMMCWATWRTVERYRRWFQNRNHVFRHSGPYEAVADGAVRFVRYAEHRAVPAEVLAVIKRHGGERALGKDRAEMQCGAALWVAFIGDEVAGTSMSRRGRDFRSWFVPLADEDIVIFRNRTYPEHRGKGVCPRMMRHIMHTELAEGGMAYVDCRVYNKPSIRSIEKAGFELMATMKPITREAALGQRAG